MAEPASNQLESDLDKLTKRWNAPWLGKPKEVLEIKDENLRKAVVSIGVRPDGMNSSIVLSADYLRLQERVQEKTIDEDESNDWLILIANEFEQRQQTEQSQTPPLIVNIPERTPNTVQPNYLGAVIQGGEREMYVVDKGLIEMVDVSKQEDRDKFVLLNMYAFNFRFMKPGNMGTVWKQIIDQWEDDITSAREKNPLLEKVEMEMLTDKLRAAMAVSTSARAMEDSGGAWSTYGSLLTGGEKGANNDWQDKNAKYIIHASPEKIELLLSDPLVKKYYDRLIDDTGLSRVGLEWDLSDPKQQKPNILSLYNPFLDPTKVNVNNFVSNAKDKLLEYIANRSPLVKYLKDSASGGGFNAYINEVLLNEVSVEDSIDNRSRMAAAKIACDIFLVDKWTRWEDLVDRKGNLSLQPTQEWSGDPLKAVLNPTFLPRLKGVYTGPDEVVLDAIDLAFRPKDIYLHINDESMSTVGKPVEAKVRLTVPSMVTNLKTLARYNIALDKFLGGPMASNIPNWSSPVMNDLSGGGGVFDLVDQVWGAQKYKVPDGRGGVRDYEVGKHIAGTISMRILYAKALAVTLESDKPGFAQRLQTLFDPGNKTRPNLEILMTLLGPNRDGTRGLIKALQGGRLDFVLGKNNVLGANKYQKELMRLLESDDQTGGTDMQQLNTVGFGFDIATALANASGLIGSRR